MAMAMGLVLVLVVKPGVPRFTVCLALQFVG